MEREPYAVFTYVGPAYWTKFADDVCARAVVLDMDLGIVLVSCAFSVR